MLHIFCRVSSCHRGQYFTNSFRDSSSIGATHAAKNRIQNYLIAVDRAIGEIRAFTPVQKTCALGT